MMSRSVRPGHTDDNATEPPLARAIRLRATRPRISVEIRLRCDTPCLGWEDSFRAPFNPEMPPKHHLERRESARPKRKVVQNQHLVDDPRQLRRTSRAA